MSFVGRKRSNTNVMLQVFGTVGSSSSWRDVDGGISGRSNCDLDGGARRDVFAACSATSFGDLRPERRVDWIEANRMFGVTRFNVYDGGIMFVRLISSGRLDKGTLMQTL